MTLHRSAAAIFVAASALASGAFAELPIPVAGTPEEVGLSSAQLARIEEVARENVKAGVPAGAVILVARKGKVGWYKAIGDRDRDARSPMRTNAIFRLYSMTKPVVSVATLMLVEEGKLQLTDPVSKYIPAIANMKVGVEKAEPQRAMTIQDLLLHTSGLIYPGGSSASPVNEAYNKAGLLVRDANNAEFVSRLSTVPLRFSPGTKWEYGVSIDVLGRVLEVIEGKSLGEILEARIFRPLGMVDTAFYVPAWKLNRVAQPWRRPGVPPPPQFDVSVKPDFESGGHGLVGTAEDYLRFTLMLLNGGELNGVRILGRKSVESMTADHVGDLLGRPGWGFGYGFEVRTAVGKVGVPGSVGEYGWAGYAGTVFWVDPKEELIAIYLAQVSEQDRMTLRNQFRAMLQGAIK